MHTTRRETPNARRELRLAAGARHERTLEAVSSTPLFGWGCAPSTTLQNPCTPPAFFRFLFFQGRDRPSSAGPTPSSGYWHTQLLTDAGRCELRDFAMARYRGPPMRRRI